MLRISWARWLRDVAADALIARPNGVCVSVQKNVAFHCGDGRESVRGCGGSVSLTEALAAIGPSDWQGACDNLAAVGTARELGPPDLERWADAARRTNRASDSIDGLERAQAARDAAGEELSSARWALLLCRRHFESGEDVIPTRWLRPAERMLDGSDECALHGRLALRPARGMLPGGAHQRWSEGSRTSPRDCPSLPGSRSSGRGSAHDPMGVARERATLGCSGV
jgi:hypothetical protein